ncbi:amp dependent CoA ligase [Panus rudis PR-1116 ss-1]|nr:amp dependent CoA ligase [Panus rudis PR-1116 ss-1]
MSETRSATAELPHIPDDLTIPQFFLDHRHMTRPLNTKANPWFIDESTGRQLSFEEIRARTSGLANALSSKCENDVVCIFSPNHIYYPICVWALLRLGAIVTGANPAYTAEELELQLNITNATRLITHSSTLASGIEAAHASSIPDSCIALIDMPPSISRYYPTVDELTKEGLSKLPTFVERKLVLGEAKKKVAFLSFSSGTTGKPKAVVIPHHSFIANVIQMAFHANVEEQDRPLAERLYRPGDAAYGVVPFFHAYGLLIGMHFYTFMGFTLVVSPRFNFVQMLKSTERYRISHLLVVPPMVVLLCKNPLVKHYDMTSLRYLLCGAAPLSSELVNEITKVLPQAFIHQIYGMTETAATVTWPRISQKIGTVGCSGVITAGITVRVIKENGSLARFNEPGELYVKSPANTLGYMDNEEATKETFIDGWVRTGDEVIINEDTEVFIIDRMKARASKVGLAPGPHILLNARTSAVAPAELEGHLLTHPDVSDVCVVGVPDEYSGEVPLAFIVPSAAAAALIKNNPSGAQALKEDIMKYVADNKVYYKKLAGGVEFTNAIPKNPSGKLLRRLLRDKARELRQAQTKARL